MGKQLPPPPREEEEEEEQGQSAGASDSDSAPEVVAVSDAKATYLTGRQGRRAQQLLQKSKRRAFQEARVEEKRQRIEKAAAASPARESEEREEEEEEKHQEPAPSSGIQPLPTAVLEEWVASKEAEVAASASGAMATRATIRKRAAPTKTRFHVVPLTRKERQDQAAARVPEAVANFRRDRMAAIPRAPFSLVR